MLMLFFLIMILLILINVAFYTLLERKIISSSQNRVGPNKVFFMGILQPVFDGFKLFLKSINNFKMNSIFFYISPVLSFFFSYLIWYLFFFVSTKYKLLIFIILIAFGVYPFILSGWSSFSKYSYIGSIRASSQTVSYEIILIVLLFSVIFLMQNVNFMTNYNFFFFFFPLIINWMISILSETNRAPFDFSEGESELISGFNTEYGSSGFVLFFLGEYSMMIFFSFFMMMFFNMSMIFFFFMLMLLIYFRLSYPRFRYDFLYSLMWYKLLPFSFFFFLMLYFL